MIKLTKITVHKYKSIQKTQAVAIEPNVTTIVGMNESGKTNFLEVLAKTNYFEDDKAFKYDVIHDYPRSEYIEFQKSGNKQDIIKSEYSISEELLSKISEDIGEAVFTTSTFSYICRYGDSGTFEGIKADTKTFFAVNVDKYELTTETKKEVKKLSNLKELDALQAKEGDNGLADFKERVKSIIGGAFKNWTNPLEGYIAQQLIKPNMPKFWYFDEYYDLRGKININKLVNSGYEEESDKTAKALFDLAGVQPSDIINTQEYERFIALLEASSIAITKEMFNYWTANQNLDIEFKIQEVRTGRDHPYYEKVLDIRVKNQRHKISLPLDRRSKGFQWFFSFIVWFSKIQGDSQSNYILLLDEPGLNLHASAQADLLRFIEELSKKYQVIYTTHSPFMVDSSHLNRVRTCLETDSGTIISETLHEKDPKTLFPLQAALGYDIAQNLFISKHNLLVEGPADLIYLTVMSNILESEKRTSLSSLVTIVPVGGLDKVATFISLLKGSQLDVACLLDTFTDQKGKQRVEDLVKNKIIKEKSIRFFHEFSNNGKQVADIEDLFSKEDYLKIFNSAFGTTIKTAELDNDIETIVKQVNKAISQDRYNHYKPANKLNQMGVDKIFFSESSLNNFEQLFKEINHVFAIPVESMGKVSFN